MRFAKSKKADKSLQMIFGLFLLLIISLVVLNLFFKFTEKSSSKMESSSTEYFSKAQKAQAIQECQALCDAIKDKGTAMNFCKQYYSIDWNGNQIDGDKISEGSWDFCEEKIPCFVLVDNCGGENPGGTIYNYEYCAKLLSNPANHRTNWYCALENPGNCGLDDSDANWNKLFKESVPDSQKPNCNSK